MKVSLSELAPWTDVFDILSNARSLTVEVDGKKAKDSAELTVDAAGNVTLAVNMAKKKK